MWNPSELPIVHINNFIWQAVSGSVATIAPPSPMVWNTASYQFVPFYPVSENLAPNTSLMPFVIYDYMFLPKAGTFWPVVKEQAEYLIVGEVPQIMYVKNYIFDLLRKYDQSAAEVNSVLSASAGVHFKYITVSQNDMIMDERRIESFRPKFVTSLRLTYEYTK